MKKFSVLLCAAALLCACSMKDSREGEPTSPGIDSGDVYPEDGYIDGGDSGNQGQNPAQAGKLTAGEWRDLDHWDFWSHLMAGQETDSTGKNYAEYNEYWGFYTNNRVAVSVLNEAGEPQRDVPVKLIRKTDNTTIYAGRTDNTGRTNLWIGLTQHVSSVDHSTLALVVNGQQLDQEVSVTYWGDEEQWNECTASVTPTRNIDICFIVDATGSMMDEIAFLKQDLTNIITTVQSNHTDAAIRTAALFYRDQGDDYLTRVNNFTSNLSQTVSFIEDQHADGGGDYPEAVHTALEVGLQDLSWREENSIRLAFMLLDAPPHHQDDVITSLHASIPQYAQKGIRIIPVAASGVDKPTEFFLRYTAMATDGTYVFLTNDSGIGGDHIEATVGEYQVEYLNALVVRLIDQYLQ